MQVNILTIQKFKIQTFHWARQSLILGVYTVQRVFSLVFNLCFDALETVRSLLNAISNRIKLLYLLLPLHITSLVPAIIDIWREKTEAFLQRLGPQLLHLLHANGALGTFCAQVFEVLLCTLLVRFF